VVFQGQTLGSITLSFGVAVFPEHGKTPEDLIQSADRALYRAKTKGRNCVVVAD
jgi:diguanylate cyclase (GGDEF)-like protein